MQNINELLIDPDELRTYTAVAKNVNTDNRILAHIIEAQQFDVGEWLGNEFYFDIWQNKASYTTLLEGGSYVYEGKTLQLYGLKPFICLMAAIRIIKDNDVQVTSTGNVVKDTEQSERASFAAVQDKIRQIQNRALPYKDNISTYLCRNRALYPLYCGCSDNVKVEDKTLQIFNSKGKWGATKW